MTHELTVRVDVPLDRAKAALESIGCEVESDRHVRSEVELEYDGGLVLRISAKDLSALRAAANTYLRWMDMCLKLTGN